MLEQEKLYLLQGQVITGQVEVQDLIILLLSQERVDLEVEEKE